MNVRRLVTVWSIISMLLVALTILPACEGGEALIEPTPASSPTSSATATPSITPTPSPTPTPTPLPASCKVTAFSLMPSKVAAGEETTATVSVKNTGGVAGNYTVELRIQGAAVQQKDIVVAPQSTRKVRFQVSEEQPGIYLVAAGEFFTALNVSAGFYRNSTYGLTIECPTGWEVDDSEEEQSSVIYVEQPNEGLRFTIVLDVLAEEISLEGYASEFVEGLETVLDGFSVVSQGSATVGSSIPAYDVIFTASSDGTPTKGEAMIVFNGSKVIIFVSYFESFTFDFVKYRLDSIVQTLRLEEPTLFGVPRSEALFLFDTGPTTLDPAMLRDTGAASYAYQIFSGLVGFDQDMKIVPDIAESWDIAGNGTIYTFRLHENATFHTGRAVTASDIKYSIERACDPNTDSPTAETYLADIVGVKEMIEGKATEISGVKVVDDHTLQITIDSPKSYFLNKLAHPVSFVVDRYEVESGEDWWYTPNGTGPFSLMEWQEDRLIILERNAAFYDTPAKVEYVVFNLWGGDPMIMYENGEIDATAVYQSDLERVLDPTNPLHKELDIVPQLSVVYIGFNCTKPPFDDPKIRQAFSYAIDKDKIIEVLFKDSVERADGILPPGMPGYNPSLLGLGYDPMKAKQLISESSYGTVANLPPITLTTAGFGTVSDIDTALIDMWHDNLGVEVDVRQLDPDIYPYQIMEEKDELYETGWSADYPDPQDFLDVLFHTGSKQNDGEYSNPAVDSLLEQARVEQNNSIRMQLYQQAEQMLVNDAACLPLYFDVAYMLVKPYVAGCVLNPLGFVMFKNVSIKAH